MELPKIERFGDSALLVEWCPEISDEIHSYTLELVNFLNSFGNIGILEITSTYCSVAVYLSEISKLEQIILLINNWLSIGMMSNLSLPKRTVEIPVCYDVVYGLDLEEISKTLKLPVSEIVKRHTSPLYKVYFIGFLPGFPYLGGLDDSLFVPRKATPRALVTKGSVAIGGGQTGVYSSDSPGGWNILGRTPLSLFEVSNDLPALLSAGDLIKFKSISSKEFHSIEGSIKKGVYKHTVR